MAFDKWQYATNLQYDPIVQVLRKLIARVDELESAQTNRNPPRLRDINLEIWGDIVRMNGGDDTRDPLPKIREILQIPDE